MISSHAPSTTRSSLLGQPAPGLRGRRSVRKKTRRRNRCAAQLTETCAERCHGRDGGGNLDRCWGAETRGSGRWARGRAGFWGRKKGRGGGRRTERLEHAVRLGRT